MKRILDDPADYAADYLKGLVAAHADLVAWDETARCVHRRHFVPGKVALVSGGGSGHEPMHAGFVGPGMLDAACPGRVFTSPTPDQIVAAAARANQGAGVLFIVKNYDGDRMNFEIASELADFPVATVIVADDVAVGRGPNGSGRRGVAGTLAVEKILGAAAERGANLQSLAELGAAVSNATRSIGIALSGSTAPELGAPPFTLAADEVEFGVGIHGEPGTRRLPMASASVLVHQMLDAIRADEGFDASARHLMIVNGLGGMPLPELYIASGAARCQLGEAGIVIERSLVGSFATSLDMNGFSLTLSQLNDDRLELWDAPARTPALKT